MGKLIARALKIKFIETLKELEEFSYEDGNPFQICIGMNKFFIFLKNLSSAYFKNSDVTRVQLPYSEHFKKQLKGNIPFIILGYEVDNDVFVSWSPQKIKDRLNNKANVSLYSRFSLQKQVNYDSFKYGYLTNGERLVLFKRENLSSFFENVLELFNEASEVDSIPINKVKASLSSQQRFKLWLQERYLGKSVKSYIYCIDKISIDLRNSGELPKDSLFKIKDTIFLHELFLKYNSTIDFTDRSLFIKDDLRDSFKKYIEFRTSEEEIAILDINKTKSNGKPEILNSTELIHEISDIELLKTIRPLLMKNQVLQAVEVTSKYFGSKYTNMQFKDWYKIVSEIYKKMNC